MVFRRRRDTDDLSDAEDQEGLDDILDDQDDDDNDGPDDVAAANLAAFGADVELPLTHAPAERPAVSTVAHPKGPWDVKDVPDDDEVPRVDLGGIAVPVPDGVEVRVEVQDDVPVAATLVDGNSALQVHAFAAPKSSGLWAEVRTEIGQSLRSGGGSAQDADGPFGSELRARLPQEDGVMQSARFIGVDGPRWFLRGLITGPAATDPAQAKRLEDAFRNVVVNRGTEAMAPRDMLALHLPREALEMPDVPAEIDRTLHLPERGPEITEIQ